jgi:cullin-4
MKKLTIKPFKAGPKLPDSFKEKTWEKLNRAVNSVYKKVAVDESKEELYRAVEDLCMHKLGNWLYEELGVVCKDHIFNLVDSLIGKTSDQTVFLMTMDQVWREHCDQMVSLRNIFLHLDRNFTPPGTIGNGGDGSGNGGMNGGEERSLYQLGIAYFSQRLGSRADLESALLMGLLASVESDRMNVSFDEYSTKRLVRMLVTLGLYHSKFEVPFLIDTERFFLSEGQAMIESCDPADFLLHAERRLAEAIEMITRYLDATTRPFLLSTVEATLLKPHVATLIERGLKPLLQANRIVDLRRMYVLLDRVGEGEAMKKGWIEYLREAGEQLVSDNGGNSSSSSKEKDKQDRSKSLIDDLLTLHDRMDTVLVQVFSVIESFKLALKGAWEHIVNINPNKFAELLAKFLDKKMRAERGQAETDSDKQLDRIMVFFRFLYAKDVFEAFYKKLLSKRLLTAKTASNDLEKLMITKLKTECGANYTSKLEGMLQDEIISEEVKRAFKVLQKCEPDFEPKVLTVGYWPITLPTGPTTNTLRLPADMLALRDRFNEYYTNKYQGRRLVWANTVDRCVVTARLPKGKKELEVNLYQALCLLHFNKSDISASSSFKDIKASLSMDDSDLRRTLQSLACGMLGSRVLTKDPKGKDVNDDDRFSVAKDFSSKMFRINIKVIVPREVADEDAQRTHDEVFRDRQYVFCPMLFLPFLFVMVSLSLSYPSIAPCLLAFSDTT